MGQLLQFRIAWNTLCKERQEIIGYAYDQEMRLIPGTTLQALNTFFAFIDQYQEKIDEIQNQIQNLEDNIQKEIQGVKQKILRETGIITDISQLGLKYSNDVLLCRSGVGANENYVEVVVSEEYKDIQRQLNEKLNKNKLVVLTGPNGIGKSILARHIVYNLLTYGTEIISLDRVPEEKVWERLGESGERIIFYDPLSPELYLPRKV
jgi:ATPase subunit of ABC transporter with duplicated ATPase domains